MGLISLSKSLRTLEKLSYCEIKEARLKEIIIVGNQLGHLTETPIAEFLKNLIMNAGALQEKIKELESAALEKIILIRDLDSLFNQLESRKNERRQGNESSSLNDLEHIVQAIRSKFFENSKQQINREEPPMIGLFFDAEVKELDALQLTKLLNHLDLIKTIVWKHIKFERKIKPAFVTL